MKRRKEREKGIEIQRKGEERLRDGLEAQRAERARRWVKEREGENSREGTGEDRDSVMDRIREAQDREGEKGRKERKTTEIKKEERRK